MIVPPFIVLYVNIFHGCLLHALAAVCTRWLPWPSHRLPLLVVPAVLIGAPHPGLSHGGMRLVGVGVSSAASCVAAVCWVASFCVVCAGCVVSDMAGSVAACSGSRSLGSPWLLQSLRPPFGKWVVDGVVDVRSLC